ncbi:MAG TPA: hypothetical protein VFG54_16630 [Prolixibacteraceae bacterium]|nr:hypothetical protein [Prolixibacteraceae bacterium]
MKLTQLLFFVLTVLVLTHCKNDPESFTVINSESLHETQVELIVPSLHESRVELRAGNDSVRLGDADLDELDRMNSLFEQVRQSASDPQWRELLRQWNDFNDRYVGDSRSLFKRNASSQGDIKSPLPAPAAEKWARLNAGLLKLSGKVRFGDALEILLYDNHEFMFPDSLLKSVIYTHVFDDIYINLFGSSSMEYQHTTGGTVSLTQETNYPEEAEMTLTIETGDIRFMNVYIRIPSWAINPEVSYGNVKYVARPGEYSLISKKWRTGDEIRVALRN